jgi:hypothetical protein
MGAVKQETGYHGRHHRHDNQHGEDFLRFRPVLNAVIRPELYQELVKFVTKFCKKLNRVSCGLKIIQS